MQQYNNALVGKDATAIMAAGRPQLPRHQRPRPEDALDSQAPDRAPQQLARQNDIALGWTQTTDVKGDTASAVYTWVSSFKLANRSFTESDIKRMDFKRTASGWKILSGI
jgi:hypothetical protein